VKIVALSVIPMMAVMSIASAPAYGQNLLGIIGASGEDALVTIGSGNASSSGLVNLGLGGGGNQVLDAQIGGQNDLVNANVTAGGSSALGANASVLGGAARVGATVGGGNLLDLDVGVGGGGGTGGGGGNGGGGNGGGNGAGVGGGGAGGGRLPQATAAAGGGGAATCAGASANDIQRLINRTQIDAMSRCAASMSVLKCAAGWRRTCVVRPSARR
jgi:hypothetical protein